MTRQSLYACDPIDHVADALRIMGEAIEIYKPAKVFGMFSGGHDSLTACHFASRLGLFAGVVHINTGIGVEETRVYVRETAKSQGWPLTEYKSPISYESLVVRFGFPGPASHGMMYTRLKERCIRQLIREHKSHRRDRIMLVGGMRLDESVRRMGNAEPHHREGVRVWCSPIINWAKDVRNAFIDRMKLPKNPVIGKICMSGECLCGAFAKPNEFVEIAHHFPAAARKIRELEAKAKAAGVHCVWGTRPPKKEAPNNSQPAFHSLCWSCESSHAKETAENQTT